jgi:ribonucleoside-diphosphate reductase alpha chain
MNIRVTKRDGTLEPLNIEKISKSIEWAANGLNVSVSDVEMAARLHFYDSIETREIHQVVIQTTKNMISLRNRDYSKMSARLLLQQVYKEVFNSIEPYSLANMIDTNVNKLHLWKPELYLEFTSEEKATLNNAICHNRDFLFELAGLEQLLDKYCIFNNGIVIESPQHMFMAIAMDVFYDKYKLKRIERIIDMYNALSLFHISLPTPMMKTLRTNSADYASCCTISMGDTLDSWCEGSSAIMKHTAAAAGIGCDVSSIASIGDHVKQRSIIHSGKIPVLKRINADINNCQQNGRRGSGNIFINFFDPEIETIMSIKSPRTEANKRINDLKYGIKFNQLFYDRVKSNGVISLFSSRQQPELHDALHSGDNKTFKLLYEKLEAEEAYSSQISAREYMDMFISERFENGIYYPMNVDEVNANSPYHEPITQSNLCMEFLSPTKPLSSMRPDDPSIGICVLSNINQATVGINELPHYTELLVLMLNNIMHRQNHPTTEANSFIDAYTALGIGFSNHAYWLAKHGWKYGEQEGLNALTEWMEHFQFNLLSASNRISIESGPCARFNLTTYSDGVMPFDRCNANAAKLTPDVDLTCDWDTLRESIMRYGLANATLSMLPPAETSSVIGGMTSGPDPIRDLLTVKGSKTTAIYQLAPECLELADKYDFAFDRNITPDYLKNIAVIQTWIDQSSSANTYYNPELYDDNKVSMADITRDLFLAKHLGIKTLYYNNTKSTESDNASGCEGGGCAV